MAHTTAGIGYHRDTNCDGEIEVRSFGPWKSERRTANSAPFGWTLRVGGHDLNFYGYGVKTIDNLIEELQNVREKAVAMEEEDGAST